MTDGRTSSLTRRGFAGLIAGPWIARAQSILDLPPPAPGIRMTYGNDPNQFGELRLPEGTGPHPAVIFIHGGYWLKEYDLTHAGHMCVAIVKAGYAVWSLEYRRTGQRGGGYPGTLDDIRAGAKRLTQMPGIDLSRVAVAGHSAGGQLALWLAAQNAIELRSVTGLAAVSDMRRGYELGLGGGAVGAFMGCGPKDCPGSYRAASPMELLPMKVPQRLVHGTADNVVPFAFSQEFARASKNAELVPLVGAGHFELIDPRAREWGTVLEHVTAGV